MLFGAMSDFDDIMSGRNTAHLSALPDRDFIALVFIAAFIAGIVLLNIYAPGYSM